MHSAVDPVRFGRVDGLLRVVSATTFVLVVACVAALTALAVHCAPVEAVGVVFVVALLHTLYTHLYNFHKWRAELRSGDTYFLGSDEIGALKLPDRVLHELSTKYHVGVISGLGPGGVLVPHLFDKHVLLVSVVLAQVVGREGIAGVILHEMGHARPIRLIQVNILHLCAHVVEYLWWLGAFVVFSQPALLVGATVTVIMFAYLRSVHSRTEEHRADLHACLWAGPQSLSASLRFTEMLKSPSKKHSLFDSHPPNGNRLKVLRSVIK